ncbi:lysylphosphatidylglycerol synthase transmembrane domain-containing protein [Qipengyuania sp. ASV99]|uniref:lysylphosphatidylglycerol synthase transmembrane domain-containing protein n=1 Tax=Qipengyuania sp. ASV99 TaxID=3399681 RepID=UPI003A4C507E
MTQESLPETGPYTAPPLLDVPAVHPWRNVSRRSLTLALSVLPIVALINVGVLVWSLGGIDLSQRISRPELLGLAAALVFVPMLSNSLRLAIWARFLGVDLGFARALKVITGMMVANSVTPSATGGMPIKVLFLMGEGVPVRRALTLVSFQTAEDALVLFSLVGLCAGLSGFALFEFLGSDPVLWGRFSAGIRTTVLIAAMAAAGLVLIVAMVAGGVFGRRARNFAFRMVDTGREYVSHIVLDWGAALRHGKGAALINITLAGVQWLVRFSIAGLVLAAFGIDWQPVLFWLLQYLVQSISSIVPTPGGAGGAEAGFLFLFAPFVPVDVLVPAMSAWRLMFFYLPLTGAACLFFLLTRKIRIKLAAPAAPPQPAE